MEVTRKSFLKGALSALALATTGKFAAEAASSPSGSHQKGLARGLTILTFMDGGKPHLGVKTEKGILNVPATAKALNMHAPATVDDLLQNEDGIALMAVVDAATKGKGNKAVYIQESAITYGPLVTRPEKIVCVGLNYREHAKEIGKPEPKVPVLFNKFNTCLNSHNGQIKLPTAVAKKFDYEVEMVMLVGREAKNVSEADALNYIAGYATGNDFSARDLQLELDGGQWMVGKTCDGFAVVGPHMVTADQVDPDNLKVELRVNGETRQSSCTADFIHNTRKMVSYISHRLTLKPGDIIFTGTPQGVIAGKPKDQQVWLKAGDKIACSIEKLGEQRFELV